MNIIFRPISIEEMKSGIFKFNEFPEVYWLSSKMILNKKDFYGLFLDKDLIGIADIKIKGNKCKLKGIEIKKKYQSQNYGSLLLENIEDTAKKYNCNEIYGVPRDYRVYDFYKKAGWKYIHEHLVKKEI